MATNRTLPEKVGDWQQAFHAVAEELPTTTLLRSALQTMTAEGVTLDVAGLRSFQMISHELAANDRAAAMVAALLTANGVKPVSISGDDDPVEP